MMTESHPEIVPQNRAVTERDLLVKQCIDWRRTRMVPTAFISPTQGKPREVVEQIVVDDAQRIFGAAIILHNAGLKNILHWLKFVTRINDSMAIWGDLPLYLARADPRFDHDAYDLYEIDMDGKRIDADAGFSQSNAWAVVCAMGYRGGTTMKTRWTLADCHRAGHYNLGVPAGDDSRNKPAGMPGSRGQFERGTFTGGVWAKFPRRMMEQRAIQWSIKKMFPGALEGLQMLEYDYDTMPGYKSPIKAHRDVSAAALVAKRFEPRDDC